MESEPPSEQQQHTLSVERHAVVSKVQQLKSEFSKLLQELRRKQSSVTHAVVQEVLTINIIYFYVICIFVLMYIHTPYVLYIRVCVNVCRFIYNNCLKP